MIGASSIISLLPARVIYITIAAATAFVTWQVADVWGFVDDKITEHRHAKEISELRKKYKEQQELTREVSDDYHEKVRGIRLRYADAISRVCNSEDSILRFADTTSSGDARTASDGLHKSNREGALHLLNLAAIAEDQTAQLQACQQFIRDVWAAN